MQRTVLVIDHYQHDELCAAMPADNQRLNQDQRRYEEKKASAQQYYGADGRRQIDASVHQSSRGDL